MRCWHAAQPRRGHPGAGTGHRGAALSGRAARARLCVEQDRPGGCGQRRPPGHRRTAGQRPAAVRAPGQRAAQRVALAAAHDRPGRPQDGGRRPGRAGRGPRHPDHQRRRHRLDRLPADPAHRGAEGGKPAARLAAGTLAPETPARAARKNKRIYARFLPLPPHPPHRLAGHGRAARRHNAWAAEMGFKTVPRLYAGEVTLDQLRDWVHAHDSQFRQGHLEGIVVRRENADWLENRAKLVRADFTQTIEAHWKSRALEWNRVV